VDDELPDRPPEEMESAKCGNFDFKEILVEDLLRLKSTVINRAPIMTAWATIVAERLGFEREESLSIGECVLHRLSSAADANFTDSKCVHGDERGLESRFNRSAQPQQRGGNPRTHGRVSTVREPHGSSVSTKCPARTCTHIRS